MRAEPFPTLSRARVRELDRIAIEEFGLPSVVLMENAGRNASAELLRRLPLVQPDRTEAHSVVLLCGAGNNGGDGYVVARHLHEAGLGVVLLETARPEDLSPDAAVFRHVTQRMGLTHSLVKNGEALHRVCASLPSVDVFVDALLGTGFQGELRTSAAELLRTAGEHVQRWGAIVVALDVPSGLDVDSGQAAPETLRAAYTFTFGANKIAYQAPASRLWTGEVTVLSIGAPRLAYERIS